MEITQHALARMQQRGIRPDDVECLLRYGRVEYDHHGGRVLFLDRQARDQLGARTRRSESDRLRGLYAIVASDGAVLTVGHRTRRIKRT